MLPVKVLMAWNESLPHWRQRYWQRHNGYNSKPGEILTITYHARDALYPKHRGILHRVESDKRTMWGAQHVYHTGIAKPNYPLPALRTE